MKVVKVSDTYGTDREVHCPRGGFVSYRPVVARDEMGFSICKTVVPRGDWQHWRYDNHCEACFCVEGRGWLKNVTTGDQYLIEPGSIYLVERGDDHLFKAETHQVVLISIFNPPLVGDEVHDKSGTYPAELKIGS